jgi:hypothetical protein
VPDAVPDEAGRAWPDEAVGAMPDEAVGAMPDEAVKPVPVEQRVREQVAALDGIEDVPLAEHAQRYDEVHAALQAALVEIDGESG